MDHHKSYGFSKFAKLLCVLTVIGLLDAHMALMQAWAWVSMLNDRIPEQGIEQALDTTFSGEHPCEKCLAIVELKAKDTDLNSPRPFPTNDVEQVAKLIGIVSPARNDKFYPMECIRIPFMATHLRAPNDFILAVPSPPPRFV